MTAVSRTSAIGAALAATAAAWALAMRQMHGMDMGVGTELGSFRFFAEGWVPMMAAMMLPGALPALLRLTRRGDLSSAPLFALSYLAVWAAVGLAVYALYQPHSHGAAGALVAAVALYELTPVKRECRRRCRTDVRSGFAFGAWCVGSSIGLMVMFVALGVMSVVWMSVVTTLVLAQKLLPPKPSIDVPLAVAILVLGVVIASAP